MSSKEVDVEVVAVKDGTQRPVPTVWRPILAEAVNALVVGDYELKSCRVEVVLADPATPAQMQDYIQGYGATLVALPKDSWESSVCIWYESYWDVLVDLWTEEEGRSDLVLKASVTEAEGGISVQVQMVYVP